MRGVRERERERERERKWVREREKGGGGGFETSLNDKFKRRLFTFAKETTVSHV